MVNSLHIPGLWLPSTVEFLDADLALLWVGPTAGVSIYTRYTYISYVSYIVNILLRYHYQIPSFLRSFSQVNVHILCRNSKREQTNYLLMPNSLAKSGYPQVNIYLSQGSRQIPNSCRYKGDIPQGSVAARFGIGVPGGRMPRLGSGGV